MRTGPFWTRLAAASGIGFSIAAVVAYALQANKDLSAGGMATGASDNMWATWTLFVGLAAVLLLWFTSTSTARLREIEGGSRRVSAEHFAAGTAVAAVLLVEVAVQFAARGTEPGSGLESLATSLVSGPALAFGAGVYILAAGVVGTRAGASLPVASGVLARVSVLHGIALIAGACLWLYRDYAWINDTAFFSFVVWVFLFSFIGVFRWSELDADSFPISLAPATRRPAVRRERIVTDEPVIDELEDTFEVPRVTRRPRPSTSRTASRSKARSKTPARKASARKGTSTRKAGAGKAGTARKATTKRAPRRKPTPPPPPNDEGLPPVSEEEADAETLEGFGVDRLEGEDRTEDEER